METPRTQVSETVLPREIDGLPINGRHYLDLAALTPAVTRSNPVSNQRFPETSAVPGTGLSITGQRRDRQWLRRRRPLRQRRRRRPARDVLQPGGDPRVPGDRLRRHRRVRPRVGGHRQHSHAVGLQHLARARLRLPARRRPRRAQPPGSHEGPAAPVAIRRDRLGSPPARPDVPLRQRGADAAGCDGRDHDRPESVAAINARLDAVGYRGPRIATGLFATGYDTSNVFFKVDHRLSGKASLAARYSAYDISSENARNVGGLNAVSRGTALENTDHTLAVDAVVTLSPRTLNETRVQVTRSRLGAPPNDLVGPAVNIAGVATLGTATFSPTARGIDLYEIANVTTSQRGAHAVKAGVDVLWNRIDIEFPGAMQGVYTFPSLANFEAGRYVDLPAGLRRPVAVPIEPEPRPLRPGRVAAAEGPHAERGPPLRPAVPARSHPDRRGQPLAAARAGLVLRARGGRSCGRASAPTTTASRCAPRPTRSSATARSTAWRCSRSARPGAPVFPAVLPDFPRGLLASITTIDPDIQAARSWQASAQVDRRAGAEHGALAGLPAREGERADPLAERERAHAVRRRGRRGVESRTSAGPTRATPTSPASAAWARPTTTG